MTAKLTECFPPRWPLPLTNMSTFFTCTRLDSRRLLLGLSAFFACLVLARAQGPATGTVMGRVFNPSAKEYVRDAEVKLEGTSQVTYTENDGSFQFNNVPAGETALTVTYSGYNPVRQSFTVETGKTAVREVNLVSAETVTPRGETVMLEAFTVSSEREGNSKAIMSQRRNLNITTSVSSDIFGDVADGNVGEFLKYLPGIDLDYVESEPRGPRLGGMDSQYTGVSFDGMRTASADANRGGGAASRATSFEGFSITSIESIEINRTSSAENDADSPGGSINMRTKRAFDRKGRRFDYNYGMNFNSEEFTLSHTNGPRDHKDYKWRPNYQLSYAESFFNQRFGVLLSATQANSYTEQMLMTNEFNSSPTAADPRPHVIRQIDFKDGPKFVHKDSLLLTADWKATSRLVISFNAIYSYYEGEFWNRNFTFVAANDNANVNNGRSRVEGDGLTTIIATRAPSGSVNNVATLNNGGGSSAKLTYTRQFAPKFEYKAGGWIVDGSFAFSRSVNNYESLERGFSSSEGGGVPSSWIATRPNEESWEWTIRQTSGNDWFDLRSFTSTDTRSGGTRVTNDDRTWSTEKWTGNLNARWVVPFLQRFPTVLKMGGKWDEETRNNNHHSDVNIWSYNGPGGNTTTVSATNGANVINSWGNWANVGPEFISANPFEMGTTNAFAGGGVTNINGDLGMPPRASRNAIAALFHAHPEMFVNTMTPENYYTDYYANHRDLRQTVESAYSQADLRLTSKLQFRIGVRMESTKNALTQFNPLTRAQVLAAGYTANAVGTNNGRALTLPGMMYQYESNPPVTLYSGNHNYFPSVLVKYNILPNFEWQAGANKSIGRPAVDDLTGLWVVNESNQTITAPNPTLLPERHTSYQTRLAYYWTGRSPGQFSTSFSQTESTNFVTTQNYKSAEWFAIYGGEEDPDFAAYTFVSKRNTVGLTKTRSMDWNYNQTLGFLPGEYLRGTSIGFTYARTYATVRRSGLAPHRATARLGYAYRRFNGSLGLVWIDDKPSSSTYGQFMGAVTKLDLTLNLKLTNYATLYVQGRNISNVKDEWYESPPNVKERRQRALRAMEAYGANWVFGVKGSF
jgi:iron complex outermembrane recepter protein